MPAPTPEPSVEKITGWMRHAAENATSAIPGLDPSLIAAPQEFDFKPVRRALDRARNKNEVHAPRPLRRLRRNQAAVNEGLIDACSALVSLNKQMSAEISALSAELASLRRYLAQREAAPEKRARETASSTTR